MDSAIDNGLQHIASKYSFSETVQRVQAKLQEKGLKIFCNVDHSGEAEKVGLRMHPTWLLIFGNPQGGTPVMLAAPTIAIDLPLKALLWEDAGGKVWASYNTPEYLQQRHNVPAALVANISAVGPLLAAALA